MNNPYKNINKQLKIKTQQRPVPPVKPVFLPEDFFDADGNDVDFNSRKKTPIDNLSKNRLAETLINQKNVKNTKVPLFSKNKPDFSPEEFFDDQGNEVTEKDIQEAELEKGVENNQKKTEEDDDEINCLKCTHYFVTWNRRYPRGCRVYGFETDLMPSDAVLIYTCKSCNYYKNKFKKSDPGLFAKLLENAM